MAVTPSTTTTLATFLPTGVRAAIEEVTNRANLMNYITVDNSQSAMKFPVYPELTFSSVSEGADYTIGAVTSTGPTITPIRYGGGVQITKEMVQRGGEQAIASSSAQLGRMIRAQQNIAIWALFDGFSGAVGTTNTNITEQNILDGYALLAAAGAPEPYTLAVTPHVMRDLVALYKASTSITALGIREQITQTGIVSKLFGIDVIQIGDLAAGTSAGQRDAADAKCGLFSRSAIGAVVAQDLTAPGALEIEWSNLSQSWTLTATTYFGVGEIKDAYGVEVLVDNKD